MILDHQNRSKVHPFFGMGGKGLQNRDFQILRKNRKRPYYVSFHAKQDSGNSIEVKDQF